MLKPVPGYPSQINYSLNLLQGNFEDEFNFNGAGFFDGLPHVHRLHIRVTNPASQPSTCCYEYMLDGTIIYQLSSGFSWNSYPDSNIGLNIWCLLPGANNNLGAPGPQSLWWHRIAAWKSVADGGAGNPGWGLNG